MLCVTGYRPQPTVVEPNADAVTVMAIDYLGRTIDSKECQWDLSQPLPPEDWAYWNRQCTWYLILDGQWIAEEPSFVCGGNVEVEADVPLAEYNITPGTTVFVTPKRVGLGPIVHFQVNCLTPAGQILDRFQAVLPCVHQNHDKLPGEHRAYGWPNNYGNLSLGKVREQLEQVMRARCPDLDVPSAQLLYNGVPLDEARCGEEIWTQHHKGGIYSDFLDLCVTAIPMMRRRRLDGLSAPRQAALQSLAEKLRESAKTIAAATNEAFRSQNWQALLEAEATGVVCACECLDSVLPDANCEVALLQKNDGDPLYYTSQGPHLARVPPASHAAALECAALLAPGKYDTIMAMGDNGAALTAVCFCTLTMKRVVLAGGGVNGELESVDVDFMLSVAEILSETMNEW